MIGRGAYLHIEGPGHTCGDNRVEGFRIHIQGKDGWSHDLNGFLTHHGDFVFPISLMLVATTRISSGSEARGVMLVHGRMQRPMMYSGMALKEAKLTGGTGAILKVKILCKSAKY
jgi:hypothetical protein